MFKTRLWFPCSKQKNSCSRQDLLCSRQDYGFPCSRQDLPCSRQDLATMPCSYLEFVNFLYDGDLEAYDRVRLVLTLLHQVLQASNLRLQLLPR